MKADISKHPYPVRRYIRAAEVDGLPDIADDLRAEICGCIRIPNTLDENGEELWHVTFAWPTFSELQDRIKDLVWQAGYCEHADALPAASVQVEIAEQVEGIGEMVGELKGELKGEQIQPTKTTVTKTLREHAASYCFAAER